MAFHPLNAGCASAYIATACAYSLAPKFDTPIDGVSKDWVTPKPAYNAYRNMVTRLTNSQAQGRLDPYERTSDYAVLYNFDGVNSPANCAVGYFLP